MNLRNPKLEKFIDVMASCMSFILVGAVLSVLYGLVFMIISSKKTISSCEIVNGTTHIYQGQCLPEGYMPEDLVPLSSEVCWLNTSQRLSLKAKVMVEQLIADARRDGYCLVITSGYRSYEEQSKLYDATADDRKNYIALPGSSEHQTGLAVDFTACPMNEEGNRDDTAERLDLLEDFEDLPEYRWLKRYADEYGFERSFFGYNMDTTGYAPESWHWMFIGE